MTDSNGQDTRLEIRISEHLVNALDEYAATHHIKRAEAVRRAIVALTGSLPAPRKKRSDALIPCPVHLTVYADCYAHDKLCETPDCACLYHD